MSNHSKPTTDQLLSFRSFLEPFQVFSENEWESFSIRLYLLQLKKRDSLVELGETFGDMTYLAKGSLRYFFDREGELITNYFSFQGELVGSYSSFISGKPSRIGVDAIEDCELVVLSKKNLEEVAALTELAFKMEQMRRKIAEFMILCYENRVLSFLTQTPEERYLQLLNGSVEVFQKIPQHYIAHYLGVTPVSLSRIRNRSRHTINA